MALNSSLLENYRFVIDDKSLVFCPNCFKQLSETGMNKHFVRCSEIVTGRKRAEEGNKIILEIWDDSLFKSFLRRFNKFLRLYTGEFREFNYSKNYDYWLLQYNDPQFKKLGIGLAYVRFDHYHDRFVLATVIIFPKNNIRKGYGKWFVRNINEFYKKVGGVIIESPNNIGLKLAEGLGIDYYYGP